MTSFEHELYSALDRFEARHGGRRRGSGRKKGVNDGRVRITLRVRPEALARFGARPLRAIRKLIEGAGMP